MYEYCHQLKVSHDLPPARTTKARFAALGKGNIRKSKAELPIARMRSVDAVSWQWMRAIDRGY
jgi:hypothetical protein